MSESERPHASDGTGIDEALIRADLVRHLRHDMRSLVGHVVGYSSVLQQRSLDEGWTGLIPGLRKLETSGFGLLGFLDEVLDLAKIDAGKLEPNAIRAQLHGLLDSIGLSEAQLRKEAGRNHWQEALDGLTPIHSAWQQLLAIGEKVVELSQFDLGQTNSGGDEPPLVNLGAPAVIAAYGATEGLRGSLLVVDDNDSDRELLAWLARRFGHQVSMVSDGFEAIELLRQQPFDLVLLDVVMPEMTGFDVLEEVKNDEHLRHIPVIVVSALDGVEWVAQCIEAGAEDYLAKPLDPVILRARINASLEKKRLRDLEIVYLEQIGQEKKRSDELLHVILPGEVVAELKATNAVRPKRHERVAILFCDVVSFTPYCEGRSPDRVVADLEYLIEACERLAIDFKLQKIKTMGDAFMAACGLLVDVEDPVLNCVQAGFGMITAAQQSPAGWNVRVGIHVGPVVSGIVGKQQYLFDIWGDTVNVAARMESHGVPGYVTVSRPAWDTVAGFCIGESLGMVPIKGKGEQEMFRIMGLQ